MFILVLGGSAALDAFENRAGSDTWQTMLFVAGVVSIMYGGASYGLIAGQVGSKHPVASPEWMIWLFLGVLSVSYFIYKVAALRRSLGLT